MEKACFIEKITQDGEIILDFETEYPTKTGCPQADDYFLRFARSFLKKAKKAGAKRAREKYVDSAREGKKFVPFVMRQTFEYYEFDGIISVFTCRYIFFGGLNGYTACYGDSFGQKSGKPLRLRELFSADPRKAAITEITKQIKKDRETNPCYYDGAERLAARCFKRENFYITPKSLRIFYPQYSIGPHCAGVPCFSVRYDKLPERQCSMENGQLIIDK